MMIAILVVLLLVCALGWLNQYVSTAALIMCILEKGYTPPSEAEMKACAAEVWKRVLKIKSKNDL